MNLRTLAEQIQAGKFRSGLETHLSADMRSRLQGMNVNGIESWLGQVIRNPIDLSGEGSRELLELYYTAAWHNLFEKLHIPAEASLFEIGAGDTVYMPRALNAFSGSAAYVTANLNKQLTQNFLRKTADLSIQVRVIEEDGARILDYCEPGTFEVVSFHHAINDIVQTIIAGIEGIDTVTNNWWAIEPQMLQAVMRHHEAGTLRKAAFEPFVQIVDTCRRLLKQGGYMIFDNCTYAGYEQLGYSSEFHSNYINLARAWITEAGIGLEEVELPSFDRNWWMILRKA